MGERRKRFSLGAKKQTNPDATSCKEAGIRQTERAPSVTTRTLSFTVPEDDSYYKLE